MSFFDGFKGPSTPSRTRPHGNLAALRIAVVVLFVLLAVQLFRMQIVDGSEYAQRSRDNHITEKTSLPPRGLIYDRNGEPLVANTAVFAATIIPEFLPEDADARYRIYLVLEELLGVPALEIEQQIKALEDENTPYIEATIKRNLTREQALRLEEATAELPGVSLSVKPGRQYIAGNEFSHILGYIGDQTAEEYAELVDDGYALNEQIGKTGIEARYEEDLRGTRGVVAAEQDAQGHLIQSLASEDAIPGNGLKLSIDSGLQRYIAQLLTDNLAANVEPHLGPAATAAAVVMDPYTGEIYAIVSIPSYDNNIFSDLETRSAEYEALLADPRKPLLNKALSPTAPGSTFKLVTAAAALEAGRITPSTGFTVANRILEIKGDNGEIYQLVDWRAHGYVDLYGAIAWSSNQYMFMASCGILGESRGLARDSETSAVVLGYYARGLGYGQFTGVDIGGEDSTGVVPDPAWKKRAHAETGGDGTWYYADTCFMAVGQGDVTATPLQVARATAAIANGGTLVTPHVVSDVLTPGGEALRAVETESTTIPVSDENLAHIRRGMHESVTIGAGIRAQQPNLDIAGKTGTAEFKLPGGGTSEHAWFTGYAPFDNPQVVVTVYFDVGVGGQKAAPVAGQILSYFMENVAQ